MYYQKGNGECHNLSVMTMKLYLFDCSEVKKRVSHYGPNKESTHC